MVTAKCKFKLNVPFFRNFWAADDVDEAVIMSILLGLLIAGVAAPRGGGLPVFAVVAIEATFEVFVRLTVKMCLIEYLSDGACERRFWELPI